jgi:hypothetical protein
MTDFLGFELMNRLQKKKPPGGPAVLKIQLRFGAYARISLPPVALEKLK